jgi:BirA family biotin operon repressor/biotin-[acetyl-CoA-carboxylase] ligase
MTSAAPHAAPATLTVPADTEVIGHRILVYPETDSTNNRVLAAAGDGLVVVADRQTAGRGRHGRQWHSAAGLGLWFSVGLDGELPGLTFAAALAVRDAVAPVAALTVKWPNDLILHGKKLCGILVENRRHRTALGIGLNLLHREEDLPPELRDQATSLLIETGQRLDRSSMLAAILEHLDHRIVALRRGKIASVRAEWTEACGMVGKRVRVHGIEGSVFSVNDAGALQLVADDGQSHWVTAEITELERME